MPMRQISLAILLVFTFFSGSVSGVPIAARADENTIPCSVDGNVEAPESASPLEEITNEDAPLAPIGTPPIQTPTPTPAAAHIVINELFPNPTGDDTVGEFIELRNLGTEAASIVGLSLVDSKGHIFLLPDITIGGLSVHSFAFSATGITLINSGGTLLLKNNDELLQTVVYPSVKEGSVWARQENGEFAVSSAPTPGTANTFPVAAPVIVNEPEVTVPAPETPVENVHAVIPNSTNYPLISEFLPDPEGSDEGEWIELFNPGTDPLPLVGWKLDDADGGSTPYTFDLDGVIAPGSYLVVLRSLSTLSLNNDGDSVRIIDPSGTVREAVSYVKAMTGKSYANVDGEWGWTVPTPGSAVNSIEEDDANDNDNSEVALGTSEEILEYEIGDMIEVADGTRASVRGVVTLAPGTLGKTIGVMQDTQEPSAIIVRFSPEAMGSAVRGAILEITGKVTRNGRSARLTMSAHDTVQTFGKDEVLSPFELEDNDGDGPILVNVAGTITAVRKTSATLEDGDGEKWKLAMASGAEPMPNLRKDARVIATGVMIARGDVMTLYIASAKDVVVEMTQPDLVPPVTAGTVASQEGRKLIFGQDSEGRPLAPWMYSAVAVAVAVGTVAGWQIWRSRKYREAEQGMELLPVMAIDKSPSSSYDVRTT